MFELATGAGCGLCRSISTAGFLLLLLASVIAFRIAWVMFGTCELVIV
jgi:hypothetical protein